MEIWHTKICKILLKQCWGKKGILLNALIRKELCCRKTQVLIASLHKTKSKEFQSQPEFLSPPKKKKKKRQ